MGFAKARGIVGAAFAVTMTISSGRGVQLSSFIASSAQPVGYTPPFHHRAWRHLDSRSHNIRMINGQAVAKQHDTRPCAMDAICKQAVSSERWPYNHMFCVLKLRRRHFYQRRENHDRQQATAAVRNGPVCHSFQLHVCASYSVLVA